MKFTPEIFGWPGRKISGQQYDVLYAFRYAHPPQPDDQSLPAQWACLVRERGDMNPRAEFEPFFMSVLPDLLDKFHQDELADFFQQWSPLELTQPGHSIRMIDQVLGRVKPVLLADKLGQRVEEPNPFDSFFDEEITP